MTQGYFLIALGERYITECEVLAKTIRKQGDNRPISLLVHEKDIEFAKKLDIFDQFILFEPSGDLWEACETSFEKYCLYPRINFHKYIPYDENIIVDSDVLCQWNPEELWKYLSSQPLPIRMLGRKNDPSWHWGSIAEVSYAYGKHVPHVHGGFFYLRKNAFLKQFFEYCKVVFWRYDEYKCKRAFRGGKVDEIIFAIAHAYYNLSPIEFDDLPAMSFNYESHMKIPSKLQTEGGQNVELRDYPPFIHMFDKLGGFNFNVLYNKIMGV